MDDRQLQHTREARDPGNREAQGAQATLGSSGLHQARARGG